MKSKLEIKTLLKYFEQQNQQSGNIVGHTEIRILKWVLNEN